jgi:hypothetical protein
MVPEEILWAIESHKEGAYEDDTGKEMMKIKKK